MATQTFELVSPFLTIYAPSKKWVGDSSLLLGQTSNRLVTGELLAYTGANGVDRVSNTNIDTSLLMQAGQKIKGTDRWVAPYFSETGRGDIVTGGNVPVLQFGPFEADTMLFQRATDVTLDANGNGTGSLAEGPHADLKIGARVYAAPVRNPISGNFSAADYVMGIAAAGGIDNAGDALVIGRISRIIGSGASAKIRVMFGVN